MRQGGPYYLISRTLGAELGGAIGVLLVFEHVVAAVYYLSTISEVLFLANTAVRILLSLFLSFSLFFSPSMYVNVLESWSHL